MKLRLLFVIGLIVGLGLISCEKEEPALTVEGNYTGSFEGIYNDKDSLTSNGYMVQVKMLNDNKIQVTGNDFDTFEVLVTPNGINVEPITQSDPFLDEFLYIGAEQKLRFTFNKGVNEAKFIGTK